MSFFNLTLSQLHWLGEESEDLCAHGLISLDFHHHKIETGATVSAAALFLMRTLKEDYQQGDFHNALLPCCGHSLYPDTQTNHRVLILGCPQGVDWDIKHLDEQQVEHRFDNGFVALVSKDQYQNQVLALADQVQAFYQNAKPKILPQNDWEKQGYLAFWAEWEELRQSLR